MLLFTIETAIVRTLWGHVPLLQILFVRAVAQLAFVVPWFLREGRAVVATDRRNLHLLRGALSLATWWCYYYAAAQLSLALSTVLTFSSVLFAALLAAPLLAEKVGAMRWGATLVGFAGILAALRPQLAGAALAILAGLTSACIGAGIILTTRRLSSVERPVTVMFYIGLVTFVGIAPFAVANWSSFVWDRPLSILAIAGLGPLGMWWMIQGYRLGEASAVAPVQYVRFVWALAIGWVVFGEKPDAWMLGGGAVVVASALTLTWWEARRRRSLLIEAE